MPPPDVRNPIGGMPKTASSMKKSPAIVTKLTKPPVRLAPRPRPTDAEIPSAKRKRYTIRKIDAVARRHSQSSQKGVTPVTMSPE